MTKLLWKRMDIKTKRNNMKVIVLQKSDYKDKACIYDAISETGYVSFQVKGARDPKSKYIWLNNPLVVADIELLEDGRYKHKMLKNASPIEAPLSGADPLEYLIAVSTIADLANRVLDNDEKHLLFNDLQLAIKALKARKDYLMVVLIFIAKLIKLGGSELEVDRCVLCGSDTDIVAFSFTEGGFICRRCLTKEMEHDLTSKQMLLIRYAFKSPDYSCVQSDKYSVEDKKIILKKLKEFIDEVMGAKVDSINELVNI